MTSPYPEVRGDLPATEIWLEGALALLILLLGIGARFGIVVGSLPTLAGERLSNQWPQDHWLLSAPVIAPAKLKSPEDRPSLGRAPLFSGAGPAMLERMRVAYSG